jgi:hypothetical protein
VGFDWTGAALSARPQLCQIGKRRYFPSAAATWRQSPMAVGRQFVLPIILDATEPSRSSNRICLGASSIISPTQRVAVPDMVGDESQPPVTCKSRHRYGSHRVETMVRTVDLRLPAGADHMVAASVTGTRREGCSARLRPVDKAFIGKTKHEARAVQCQRLGG